MFFKEHVPKSVLQDMGLNIFQNVWMGKVQVLLNPYSERSEMEVDMSAIKKK